MQTKPRRAFSLLEAVMALTITAMIIGSLGFLLIYASRTLTQSFSDSTVQQQGVVALRKLSDDMIQSNIYSLYSVGNTYNPLAPPVGGMNVTFLSPYGVSSQPNSRIFAYNPPPYPLRFQTWVGYCVDASQKLIRYDNNSPVALGPPFTPLFVTMNPLPGSPLLSPRSVADMTVGGVANHSSKVIAKGIVIQDASGTAITDGFAVNTVSIAGRPSALSLSLKIQDYYGSTRFHQLNFNTQLYPRN